MNNLANGTGEAGGFNDKPNQGTDALRWIQPEELRTDEGTDIWQMIMASITGDLASAEQLLRVKPQLAACSWGYFTPIHFAVRYGHAELVRLLLKHGANATERWLGWQDDPLTKAKDRGYAGIEELLSGHLESTFHISPDGARVCGLIRSGKSEEAVQLIDGRPELIHAGDERGNTPLHWAVLTRNLRLLDGLIERGADPDARRMDGATPLQLAIEGDYWFRSQRDLNRNAIRNAWFVVGYLVARGAAYDLWTAAAIGDTESIESFLNEDSALVQAPDSMGRRALSYAAKYGHSAAVQLLLDYGADPNAAEPDAPYGSALWHAVNGNYEDIVQRLLESGANPNAPVDASGNPLFIAAKRGHSSLVQLLYAHGAAMNLDAACCLGRLDLAGEILQANPSLVNSGGDYGPLCMAAGEGRTDLVRLLIRRGADLNAPWYANNYMGYAMEKGPELVSLLLESGADPNHANWLGVTYLHKAAAAGNLELARQFVDAGADCNAMDEEYGATPLGWAAKYGKAELVQYLLDLEADPRLPAEQSWTQPLSWARRKGHADIAELLEVALTKLKTAGH
ncbi:ankyrin repeat domain-containing protein [Paenibacillus oceani]|uniref:Ankyrin repeat domain-containing protein n=1 Tax=Paenibacillus oceani TaxID=2772510 RepID=A0A927GZK7_9BACL|nr:ankyrin repeat domain-containing protein [Paenibacillus oceani]MBD2863101.1 ankyrin repeat domain-containing protein [Paenibacillus oceani]